MEAQLKPRKRYHSAKTPSFGFLSVVKPALEQILFINRLQNFVHLMHFIYIYINEYEQMRYSCISLIQSSTLFQEPRLDCPDSEG